MLWLTRPPPPPRGVRGQAAAQLAHAAWRAALKSVAWSAGTELGNGSGCHGS
jgi:hypothetical protein